MHTEWSRREAMDMEQTVSGGPANPGRFITTGTWWLLREIEASLFTMEQVELIQACLKRYGTVDPPPEVKFKGAR